MALFIPDDGHDEAIAFYVDRLNFRVTDQLLDMGTFMQCEGDDDQHNLLLGHKADRAGINHVAYEVRDFDEVAERFELAGGSIRAAATTAAYLAVSAGRPIETADLVEGARREYRKMGHLIDGDEG